MGKPEEQISSPASFARDRMLRLDELLAILNRGKKTIALSTLAILLVVALYTFLTDPVFESTAMVAVDTRSEKRPQTDGGSHRSDADFQDCE